MNLFNKSLGDVTIDDIKELVSNKVGENRTIDYKLELHGNSDSEKRELLKDLSAFANTVGGYLIYGVKEENGLPVEIVGVDIPDFDKFKLQYENLLRTGVEPAIRGVEFHSIATIDSKSIIIITVPKSLSRPHGVRLNNHFRFFGRNSNGNHPMEVNDLRQEFLASETLTTRIKNFRNDRLAMISVDDTAVRLDSGAKIVLHMIPVSAFEPNSNVPLEAVNINLLHPIYCSGCSERFNFDGILTGDKHSYLQLFRNGIIEAVNSTLLLNRYSENGSRYIPSKIYERKIVESVSRYLELFDALEVQPPIWICLSLLGVKDYEMAVGNHFSTNTHPIDRDDLIVSEVLVDDTNKAIEIVLKPIFDCIWNACGYERSLNYDENGNWK